jgi:hypothetical protein
MIGLHSCVTIESLLIGLPIEVYYVRLKNAVFWDVSIITQLWSPIILKMKAIWFSTPEYINHCYCCENIPEDSVLWPCIVSPYGEANLGRFL